MNTVSAESDFGFSIKMFIIEKVACMNVSVCCSVCGDSRTTLYSQVSPSTLVWNLGMNSAHQAYKVSAFIC